MKCLVQTLTVVVSLLSVNAVYAGEAAQNPAFPSGHWEGSIVAPNMEVRIEIDLFRNARGEPAGTFGEPSKQVKGLPLSSVTFAGKAVQFVVRSAEGPSVFEGTLSADGQ